MSAVLMQTATPITPVRAFNEELASYLAGDAGFAALVPGGVYTRALTPDNKGAFPLVYPAPDGVPAGPRGGRFVCNVVVLPLQRVSAPRGQGSASVDLYTRVEVRAPRNDAGRTQISAVLDAIDHLHGLSLPIGPGAVFGARLSVIGEAGYPAIDDEANDKALFAFQDIRARVALRSMTTEGATP